MKIAIVGDLHLGYRQYGLDERERDFYRRWETVVTDIISRGDIDLVLQLGDIFDNHMPSSISLYEYEKNVSRLLDENITYYSITGNHTIIRKQNFMSPDMLFTHLLNIESLDDSSIVYSVGIGPNESSVLIGGVKYRSESNKADLIEEIQKQTELAKQHPNMIKILLLHQAVNVDLPYGAELEEEDLPVDVFDYIFIGHIHSRIQRTHGSCRIVYPGSIERSNIKEAKDAIYQGKGYVIFDTIDKNYQIVNIPFDRKFIFADINSEDDVKNIRDNLTEQDAIFKPIVELNFKSFDVEQAHQIADIISDNCLKLNVNVLNDNDDDKTDDSETQISISSIFGMLEQRLSKEEAVFAYELLQLLSQQGKLDDRIQSAISLSDDFFEKNYH